MLFVGDSHMRGLAELVLDQVCHFKYAAGSDAIDKTNLKSIQTFEFSTGELLMIFICNFPCLKSFTTDLHM